MFKITDDHTFSRTIKVQTPVDGDETAFREDTFEATFLFKIGDEIDHFDLGTVGGSKDFLRAVVKSTDDVVGADDKPVSYSPDLLEVLIAHHNVRIEMQNTYFEAVTKARLGN